MPGTRRSAAAVARTAESASTPAAASAARSKVSIPSSNVSALGSTPRAASARRAESSAGRTSA